jgi:hypothetical protein
LRQVEQQALRPDRDHPGGVDLRRDFGVIAVDCQARRAMDQRPKLQRNHPGIAFHPMEGAVVHHFVQHIGKAGFALQRRYVVVCEVGLLAEHHAKQRRLADGEGEVHLTHSDDPVVRSGRKGFGRHAKAVRHVDEALRDDLADDLRLVAEMPIGRGRRHTGAAAGIGQAEVITLALVDQQAGRVDQRLPQLAMVVRGLQRASFTLTVPITSSRSDLVLQSRDKNRACHVRASNIS